MDNISDRSRKRGKKTSDDSGKYLIAGVIGLIMVFSVGYFFAYNSLSANKNIVGAAFGVGQGKSLVGMALPGDQSLPASGTAIETSKSPLIPHEEPPVAQNPGYYNPKTGIYFNDDFALDDGTYEHVDSSGKMSTVVIQDGKPLEGGGEPISLSQMDIENMMGQSGSTNIKDEKGNIYTQVYGGTGESAGEVFKIDPSGGVEAPPAYTDKEGNLFYEYQGNYYQYGQSADDSPAYTADDAKGQLTQLNDKFFVTPSSDGKGYNLVNTNNGGVFGLPDNLNPDLKTGMGGSAQVTGKEKGATQTDVVTDTSGQVWVKDAATGKYSKAELDGKTLKYNGQEKKLTRKEQMAVAGASDDLQGRASQEMMDQIEAKSFDLLWGVLGEQVVTPYVKEYCKSEYEASNTAEQFPTDIGDTPNPYVTTTTTTLPGGAAGGGGDYGGGVAGGGGNGTGLSGAVGGFGDYSGGFTNYKVTDPTGKSLPTVPQTGINVCYTPVSIAHAELSGSSVIFTLTACNMNPMNYEIYVTVASQDIKVTGASLEKGKTISSSAPLPAGVDSQKIISICIKTNDPSIGSNGLFCSTISSNSGWVVGGTTTTLPIGATTTTLAGTTTTTLAGTTTTTLASGATTTTITGATTTLSTPSTTSTTSSTSTTSTTTTTLAR